VKHRLGHGGGSEEPSDVDHEFCIGDEALDVFAWIACPILQVVEKTGRIKADTLPIVKPAGAAVALKGPRRRIALILCQRS